MPVRIRWVLVIMKGRTKKAIKILICTFVGLVVVLCLLFLWFSRDPTTQLIDASGKELTAGSAQDRAGEGVSVSPFAKSQALIKRKDFAAAKAALLEVIAASDRDGEACILLCDVSRELKETDAAVDFGLKAVRLLPESSEAHLAYSKALALQMVTGMQSIGGKLSAIARLAPFKAELDRVIELDPDDTEARTMLVFSNMAPRPFGNIDTAIEVSRAIELRDPIRGKQLLAACYHRKKETKRAITLLREGIEAYPEEYSFRVGLADIYADEKRFEAADAEFRAARRDEKDESYYRSLYGQARMRIQNEFDPERAVELLDEFIAAEPEGKNMPSVAHACWRKGNALEQLGRNHAARDAYEESLRREPGLKLAEKALDDLED